MCSAIFGATSLEQLDHALDAGDMELSAEVLEDIDAAHRARPMLF